jgi:hypothetical protein
MTIPTTLPQRPDPSILSDAIPLFFIGRNGDGFWVAREAAASVGGIFLLKCSALQFAKRNAEPGGCATMDISERFELDIANHGNRAVAHLSAVIRVFRHLAPYIVVCKALATQQRLVARHVRTLLEKCTALGNVRARGVPD